MILLISAGVTLSGSFCQAPTQDRSVVAIAAFLALLLSITAQLPYQGWYVLSVAGLVLNFMVLFFGAFFCFLLEPLSLIINQAHFFSRNTSPARDTEHRAALAAGIWTAEVSLIWMVVQWAKSLPAETKALALMARLFCPVIHWPDHTVFPFDHGPDGPGFWPAPGALLMIESMIGFAMLVAAIAHNFYHHMQRRKVVTPVPMRSNQAA